MAPHATRRTLRIEDFLDLRVTIWEQHPALSSDGAFLASTLHQPGSTGAAADDDSLESYPTGAPATAAGLQVWITDTATRESFLAVPGTGRSWRGHWSPDGRRLAFFADHTGVATVWIWDRDAREAKPLGSDGIYAHRYFGHVHWAPDGAGVYMLLRPSSWRPGEAMRFMPTEAPPAAEADVVTVEVIQFLDPAGERTPFTAQLPENQPDLGFIDVSTGETRRLLTQLPVEDMHLSPDGRWVAFEGITRWGEVAGQEDATSTIYISSTSEPELVSVVEGVSHGRSGRHAPAWSPDSRFLAFVHDEAIHLAEPGGEVRAIETDAAFARTLLLWHPDGGNLIALERRELSGAIIDLVGPVLAVPATGGASLRLREPGDRPIEDRERVQLVDDRAGRAWSPDGISLVAFTTNPQTRAGEFWRIPLDGGEASLLHTDERTFSFPAPSNGRLAFAAEDEASPPDFWVTETSNWTPQRISVINPQIEEVELGRSRLISWLAPDGRELRGAILLPPGYKEGTRIPVVVEQYPGFMGSTTLHQWNAAAGTMPLQLLASRGYGVFFADLPVPGRFTIEIDELPKMLLGGINELVRLGIADPDRLGVMGQSGGGLLTCVTITHTTRFRAAVCSAGPTDLVSLFGQLVVLGTGTAYSHGQSIVEGPIGTPWENPHKYIKHSPVFHLDKVETPLLLIYGTSDPGVHEHQAGEMFVGLRRLGKPVTFLRYHGEGHVPGLYRPANRRDVAERVIAWFDEHLG